MSRAENILTWALVWIDALGLLGYGAYGIVSSRMDKAEYQGSSDVRKVEAVVTELVRKEYEDDDGDLNVDYKVTYAYEVDGTAYTGKDTYYRPIDVGDVLTIEVYRTSDGRYRESPDGNPVMFLVWCGCAAVGAILTLSLTTSAVERGRKRRAER